MIMNTAVLSGLIIERVTQGIAKDPILSKRLKPETVASVLNAGAIIPIMEAAQMYADSPYVAAKGVLLRFFKQVDPLLMELYCLPAPFDAKPEELPELRDKANQIFSDINRHGWALRSEVLLGLGYSTNFSALQVFTDAGKQAAILAREYDELHRENLRIAAAEAAREREKRERAARHTANEARVRQDLARKLAQARIGEIELTPQEMALALLAESGTIAGLTALTPSVPDETAKGAPTATEGDQAGDSDFDDEFPSLEEADRIAAGGGTDE